MSKVKFHVFSNDGVIFKERDTITEQVKIVAEETYSVTPDTDEKAVDAIDKANAAERKGHSGAMRFILTALQNINPIYGGMGSERDEDGNIVKRLKQSTDEARKQANGFKEAFRDVVTSTMKPALLAKFKGDDIKATGHLTELRAKGVFAVSSSAARKFFYITGKLPCAYNADGKPDVTRALAVSAMQKIVSEIPEEESDSHTFAAKLRALIADWEKNNGRTEDPADMSALLGYLDQWRDDVRAAETSALMATTAAMLPSTRAYGEKESTVWQKEPAEALM
jgi:hypothetical protein